MKVLTCTRKIHRFTRQIRSQNCPEKKCKNWPEWKSLSCAAVFGWRSWCSIVRLVSDIFRPERNFTIFQSGHFNSPVPKHSYSVLVRQFSIVVDATLEIDEIEWIVERRILFRFEPTSDFSSSCGAISSSYGKI